MSISTMSLPPCFPGDEPRLLVLLKYLPVLVHHGKPVGARLMAAFFDIILCNDCSRQKIPGDFGRSTNDNRHCPDDPGGIGEDGSYSRARRSGRRRGFWRTPGCLLQGAGPFVNDGHQCRKRPSKVIIKRATAKSLPGIQGFEIMRI